MSSNLEAVAVTTHADDVLGVAGWYRESCGGLARLAVEGGPQTAVSADDDVAVRHVDGETRMEGVVGRKCDLLPADLSNAKLNRGLIRTTDVRPHLSSRLAAITTFPLLPATFFSTSVFTSVVYLN